MKWFRRRQAVTDDLERRTKDLEDQVDTMSARIDRLKATGLVISVKVRDGRGRT